MVTAARVDAEVLPAEPNVGRTKVKVTMKTGFVTITIKQRKRTLSIRGIATGKATSERTLVKLEGKQEQAVQGGEQKEATEAELVARAVKRYSNSVSHCADLVHRNRWNTDHPRFSKCICPQLERWRLPKVKADLRWDIFLTKGKSGYSFMVTPKGSAEQCRVWVGEKPPKELVPQKTPETSSP